MSTIETKSPDTIKAEKDAKAFAEWQKTIAADLAALKAIKDDKTATKWADKDADIGASDATLARQYCAMLFATGYAGRDNRAAVNGVAPPIDGAFATWQKRFRGGNTGRKPLDPASSTWTTYLSVANSWAELAFRPTAWDPAEVAFPWLVQNVGKLGEYSRQAAFIRTVSVMPEAPTRESLMAALEGAKTAPKVSSLADGAKSAAEKLIRKHPAIAAIILGNPQLKKAYGDYVTAARNLAKVAEDFGGAVEANDPLADVFKEAA